MFNRTYYKAKAREQLKGKLKTPLIASISICIIAIIIIYIMQFLIIIQCRNIATYSTLKQDVKIYYGIYKLSDDMKEIQGVILTEETRTPAQFSQEEKLSETTYNTNIDKAICEFKGYLSVGTIIETQDRDTASEKHIWYPGTITITSIVLKN